MPLGSPARAPTTRIPRSSLECIAVPRRKQSTRRTVLRVTGLFGGLGSLGEEPLQLVEAVFPAVAVEGPARLGLERPLGETHLRRLTEIPKRQFGESLGVVGIRGLPHEEQHKPLGRIDLPELAGQMEGVALGRLHLDPVALADPRLELEVCHALSLGASPLGELLRVGAGVEGERRGRRKNALDLEYESLRTRRRLVLLRLGHALVELNPLTASGGVVSWKTGSVGSSLGANPLDQEVDWQPLR